LRTALRDIALPPVLVRYAIWVTSLFGIIKVPVFIVTAGKPGRLGNGDYRA
jgi:hypothetical protein